MHHFNRFYILDFKEVNFVKDKLIILSFTLLLFGFFIVSIFDKDVDVSSSERRVLAAFPTFSKEALWNGTFSNKLNTYTLDQFPLRETFRKTKNFFTNTVYQKKENHGSYVVKDTIFALDYKINEKSISHFTNIIKSVQEKYFKEKNVYYSIIPDKNYYAPKGLFPELAYDDFYKQVRKQLPTSFHEIDLRPFLTLNSYYRTDLHWKQETLEPVVKQIQKEIGLNSTVFPSHSSTFFPFYGAYYSKGSNQIKADTITYLTSDTIENTKVYNYEKQEFQLVHNPENKAHIDSYDIFLDGATSVLILENEHLKENRELILFRDSFGSSIAPLLLENYRKIILIDLRYFSSDLLLTIPKIDFKKENLDILFLYSIPIINQSFTLK